MALENREFKVLFLVNGLGLGNSTRCHAIIQELLRCNVEVRVVTSENGEWYFNQNVPEIKTYAAENLNYGSKLGKLSVFNTCLKLPKNFGILKQNARQLGKIIDEWSPDVVVTDSIYSNALISGRGIPMVAINNADMVLSACAKFVDRPKSIFFQFYCIEFLDYLFHKHVPNLVVSPHFQFDFENRHPRIQQVGLIVRKGLKRNKKRSKKVKSVVVMLSGSKFGSSVHLNKDLYPFSIEIIGRAPPKNFSHKCISYRGKVANTLKLLNKADLLVVNGGYSAVSEALFLKKPMIIIPVPGHAEQWVNARLIQEYGVGIIGSEQTLERDLEKAVDQYHQLNQRFELLSDTENGAEAAADLILGFNSQ